MRGRVTLLVGLVGTAAVIVAACSGQDPGPTGEAPDPAKLKPQSVVAGGVEIRVEPRFLDERGAGFDVSLDTHEGDLGMDMADSSRLEVGGIAWDAATWEGDPPGGHHLQGELRFSAQGPASGVVILRIEGLPEKVELAWDLEGGEDMLDTSEAMSGD